MPDPFSTTIHVVDKQYVPGSEAEEFLSIELSPDGFSFSVIDSAARICMLVAGKWNANGYFEPHFADYLHELSHRYPCLQAKWKNIYISWFSTGLTLIPVTLYTEENKTQLSGFCNSRKQDNLVYEDYMQNLNAYGLYFLPMACAAALQRWFPGHQLRHSGTILIESVLKSIRQNGLPADMVLYFQKSTVGILLFKNRQLEYYQTFSCYSADDLMYYLFYVMRQFKLDQQTLKVLCAGEIEKHSPQYDYIWSYFRHIAFADTEDVCNCPEAFSHLPLHTFYNLFHQIN